MVFIVYRRVSCVRFIFWFRGRWVVRVRRMLSRCFFDSIGIFSL